ncbi:MAG: hypothetical protein DM484_06140 [Candidatus Methylumidiphilus alinenensis]|uniref:Uncharacterized protein n=1 Tax=Candidatus Methylumidiphilus alinenensis TaxID=2202197 RepID=A0A2W4T5H7_9GAMM|nr:MAG: hypothetical protein DM484_06140 [Candidatus Methylumidiphilus alinenensis]
MAVLTVGLSAPSAPVLPLSKAAREVSGTERAASSSIDRALNRAVGFSVGVGLYMVDFLKPRLGKENKAQGSAPDTVMEQWVVFVIIAGPPL